MTASASDPVFFDHASTTPLRQEALQAYLRASREVGNPASLHQLGERARDLLEEARERCAQALGLKPRELLFNSGASEGNTQVLLGLGGALGTKQLAVSRIEHSSVVVPARRLEAQGIPVAWLQPDRAGVVRPGALAEALRRPTGLVSVMYANNEIGSVQPVAELAELAHAAGALLHCDMVQCPGVLPVDLSALGADLATFSAHKFGGPRGVGLLYRRRGIRLPPLILGGEQEDGERAGTQNPAGALACAVALELAVAEQVEVAAQLRQLQRALLSAIRDLPGLLVNGSPEQGSPKVLSVSLAGVHGESLLMQLDLMGICASVGSACAALAMQPSHVLLALGHSQELARATIRFSFGRTNTLAEVERAARSLREAAKSSALQP